MIEDRYLRVNGFPDDMTWEDLALTRSATRSQWYELVFADDRTTLYRIRWDRLPAEPAMNADDVESSIRRGSYAEDAAR
jgi:hypothetical protein